jgi:AmmeMemoRadiSam system protein A
MSQLSNEDRFTLLEFARRAIVSVVSGNRIPDVPAHAGALSVPGGAFVTLHQSGRLRGCVGQVEHPGPLAETVVRAAINAALHDARFPPVVANELVNLEIEISVLSPLQPIAPEAVIVGLHGLMIIRGDSRGLLLPQVAAERQWSAQQFLDETCAKAGLPSDAWKIPAARIYAFTAEVFSEASVQAIFGK